MGARLTTEVFVERARAVHGDRYDYSRVEYVNGDTKVMIVCPEHGEFSQRPRCHLEGQTCPRCATLSRASTCLSRYGLAHPMLRPECRDKARATNVARYGVENVFSSPEVRRRVESTWLSKYGVRNPMLADEVLARARATNVARYGGASSFCDADVRARHRATLLERYGVENSFQIPAVLDARRCTWLSRYGVDNPRKSPVVAARIRATCLAQYGVDYAVQNPAVRRRALSTWMRRYGVDNPWKSAVVREKIRETCVERYGVPFVLQNAEILAKVWCSRVANGTCNTSSSEDVLYNRLCSAFGADDVVRQYRSDAYPFACDFYVKFRNLYIELNASWTHGGHWFDASDESDAATLAVWSARAADSVYYENAVEVWTVRDVLKRDTARASNLNYVVFWDNELRDAAAWFERGCPDGRDWDEPWSWSWFSES